MKQAASSIPLHETCTYNILMDAMSVIPSTTQQTLYIQKSAMPDMIDLAGTKNITEYYYDVSEQGHTTRFPGKYITGRLEDGGTLSFHRERRDGHDEDVERWDNKCRMRTISVG